MEIRIDDLSGREIQDLIRHHIASMLDYSPPESVHALDLNGLKQPEVTFWSVWENGELLGCGALKELDAEHGEVKSMRTADGHLRKGVARLMLNHIMTEAQNRGYRKLSLETGSTDDFIPARIMYEKCGFEYCPPFADYIEDPYSVFMTKVL